MEPHQGNPSLWSIPRESFFVCPHQRNPPLWKPTKRILLCVLPPKQSFFVEPHQEKPYLCAPTGRKARRQTHKTKKRRLVSTVYTLFKQCPNRGGETHVFDLCIITTGYSTIPRTRPGGAPLVLADAGGGPPRQPRAGLRQSSLDEWLTVRPEARPGPSLVSSGEESGEEARPVQSGASHLAAASAVAGARQGAHLFARTGQHCLCLICAGFWRQGPGLGDGPCVPEGDPSGAALAAYRRWAPAVRPAALRRLHRGHEAGVLRLLRSWQDLRPP